MARQTAKKTTAAKPSGDSHTTNAPLDSATIAPKRYATGNEGFEAGDTAPSTKYRTLDGDVVDELPKGEGGWVLVAQGDVVTPAIARAIAGE